MKHKFFKLPLVAVFAGALLLGNTGCNKIDDFGNTNIRSDASFIPLTSNLLTSAESGLTAAQQTSTLGGLRGELYAQQMAETQYTDVSLYGSPALDFGGTYVGPLMDLQTIININTDPATKGAVTNLGSNGNQIGVAMILRSFYFWSLTDRWGDIPYTEALQGAANLFPSYDKQEDIYKYLLRDLKAGIASFDGGLAVSGDIFYAGNAAKWKKLANSLRMQIALRMSKVYPNAGQLAATEFADAANDVNGAITTNADNLVQVYSGATALTTNTWYNTLNGRTDYAFSKTFSDILDNMADGRKAIYATPGPAFPYGLQRLDAVAFDQATAGTCARPLAVRNTNTSIVIQPAAYTLLAQAEAVQRGWLTIPGQTAQTLYEAGVAASFAQWGAGSATAYLAGAANFLTGAGGGSNIGANAYNSIVGADAVTTTPLQRIQLQRYIASYADGIQAWSEWRRTGVPNLKPTAYATNNPKEIPRRLMYGSNEYGANPVKVAEAASRYTGGDVMNARMWWDK